MAEDLPESEQDDPNKAIDFFYSGLTDAEKKLLESVSPFLSNAITLSDVTLDGNITIDAISRIDESIEKQCRIEIDYKDVDSFLGAISKLQRVAIFKIDESEDISNREKISLFKSLKENIIKDEEFKNLPADVYTNLKQILDRLIMKYEERDAISGYYYNGSPEVLKTLHALLVEEKKIEQNLKFLDSLQIYSPPKIHRTVWKGKETQLIFFMYLFLETHDYKGEPLHKIIPKLFVKSDKSDYKEQSLNTQYNNIFQQFDKPNALPSGLKSIQKIFDNLA